MGHLYSGNPLNWPADVTICDDGDPNIASTFNVPDEALLDRTAFDHALILRSPRLRTLEVLMTALWTCPARVTSVVLYWCGGGGGGGGSETPVTPGTDRWRAGGGGGAGARWTVTRAPVTPGTIYRVTCGSGGGGSSLGNGSFGDGGEHSLFEVNGGAEVARALGGAGGSACADLEFSASSAAWLYAPGGVGPYNANVPVGALTFRIASTYGFLPLGFEQAGGMGGSNTARIALGYGTVSTHGFSGGSPGLFGADSGSHRGGGFGGGGGAGARGPGGNGGNGGAANSVGPATAGGNGTSGAPNTGGGGGGAGCAGIGSTLGAIGGAAGDGGSGYALLTWTEETP